jgi:hypothetical protein
MNDKNIKVVILTGVKPPKADERSGRIPSIAPGCMMEEVKKVGS